MTRFVPSPGDSGGRPPDPQLVIFIWGDWFDPNDFILLYHPVIPGRAEFVRVYLEATGVKYSEPVQKEGYGNVVSQTTSILGYLETVLPPIDLQLEGGGGKETKATEPAVVWAKNALMATIADCVLEVHNTHHPIDMMAFYEDQKKEASLYAAAFRKDRLPKFISHFERQLRDDGWLYSTGPCYVDLALWFLLAGLKYAFPNALERTKESSPKLIKHFRLIQSSPRIQAYLASDRHLDFSDGIFRRYPELDPADE